MTRFSSRVEKVCLRLACEGDGTPQNPAKTYDIAAAKSHRRLLRPGSIYSSHEHVPDKLSSFYVHTTLATISHQSTKLTAATSAPV